MHRYIYYTMMGYIMTLCAWSGGCDSTLALYFAGLDSKRVRAVSVCHAQIAAKDESARARERLTKKFKRLFGIAIDHVVVDISHQGPFEVEKGADGDGLAQPQIWLATAVGYLLPGEDLYMGYVRGDDVWHCREKLVDVFVALQGLYCKSGRLVFPLEWFTKAQIIAWLRRLQIYADCWFCEAPVLVKKQRLGRKCGKCAPCVAHMLGSYVLEKGLDMEAVRISSVVLPGSEDKECGRCSVCGRGEEKLSLGPHNIGPLVPLARPGLARHGRT